MTDVRDLLEHGLIHWQRRLHRGLIDELCRRFEEWSGGAAETAATAERLAAFLAARVKQDRQSILALQKLFGEFNAAFMRASRGADQQREVLRFAAELGHNPAQLRGDRRAFGRWFGKDAVSDRFYHRVGQLERSLVFTLERLGAASARLFASAADREQQSSLWRRLNLEGLVAPLLSYDGDERVPVAAFRSLAAALGELHTDIQEASVTHSTLQMIYRAALGRRRPVWIQCAALALLASLSRDAFETAMGQRLGEPGKGDDLFVRRRAVRLLGDKLDAIPELGQLFPVVARDPSDFVRQGLAEVLPAAPAGLATEWHRKLAREDEASEVRGSALLASLALLGRSELIAGVRDVVCEALRGERVPFVLRVATHVASAGLERLRNLHPQELTTWQAEVVPALEELRTCGEPIRVRRWAARARERIWCATERGAVELRRRLEPRLKELQPGRSLRLSRGAVGDFNDPRLGRVLSVLAQDDFGFDVARAWRGVRITRGPVFDLRLWRLLHELRTPSPDKREAHPHTVGRVHRGSLRAPSGVLAELAETQVPGEPLFLPEEGDGRPWLPLLDDLVSSLEYGREPLRIFTSEGVTRIQPPRSLLARIAAQLRLSWSASRYAGLRNWRKALPIRPDTYGRALDDLGFRLVLHPHTDDSGQPLAEDASVRRFFSQTLFSGLVPAPLRDFADYFVSAYDNTLQDLAIFTVLATGLMLGQHIHASHTLRRSRSRIPLVIGGWGTRGKSGTERLKAALMSALGLTVVSKTTGCEAMFLYGPAFRPLREMFLFRPRDKATIWEQRDVLSTAAGLGADVFLWECMALTPSYVELLQRRWTRDDLSTITNAYPDHENLQGPAGFNIADVMTRFIPKGAKLLTSEDQMLPILKEGARQAKTEIREVGWLQTGLITRDVQARFPYQEHPANLALVLALADELGIERDFALKEMADRVVPDLGVLKTYPEASYNRRRLSFTNGMSANERHGALSNWLRLGFDKQDPESEPGVWITTVVNNRADRVPRSRVFAGILVNDIAADRHFLIGGNLSGLMGYIEAEFERHAEGLTLWPQEAPAQPQQQLAALMRRLRLPWRQLDLEVRLRSMLLGLGLSEGHQELTARWSEPDRLRAGLEAAGIDADTARDASHWHETELQVLEEHRQLAARLVDATEADREVLDRDLRRLIWSWFQRKLVIIDDERATGDAIVDRIASETPPGYLNRIMGLQNIKGTGLDFVYRWQAWATCHNHLKLLRGGKPADVKAALKALSAFQDWGLLSELSAREALEQLRSSAEGEDRRLVREVDGILAALEDSMRSVRPQLERGRGSPEGPGVRVLGLLEGFVDGLDGISRRLRANRISRDLVAERVSLERAAFELQALNKRQKGGWLARVWDRLWS